MRGVQMRTYMLSETHVRPRQCTRDIRRGFHAPPHGLPMDGACAVARGDPIISSCASAQARSKRALAPIRPPWLRAVPAGVVDGRRYSCSGTRREARAGRLIEPSEGCGPTSPSACAPACQWPRATAVSKSKSTHMARAIERVVDEVGDGAIDLCDASTSKVRERERGRRAPAGGCQH